VRVTDIDDWRFAELIVTMTRPSDKRSRTVGAQPPCPSTDWTIGRRLAPAGCKMPRSLCQLQIFSLIGGLIDKLGFGFIKRNENLQIVEDTVSDRPEDRMSMCSRSQRLAQTGPALSVRRRSGARVMSGTGSWNCDPAPQRQTNTRG